MANKKTSDDDWHGVPKFVQKNWGKAKREKARKEKMEKTGKKATNKDGKGKR